MTDNLQFENLARQYELTGTNIMNVVQHACLQAIARGERLLFLQDVMDGIEKEFSKEGKIF